MDSDDEFLAALSILRRTLGAGRVGFVFDVATTTKETSNPSSVTVTEEAGTDRLQRLVILWKERQPQVVRERLAALLDTVASRPVGGRGVRLCIDATNEKYFAQETADILRSKIPVELIVSSEGIHPPGYEKPTNYKTFLGDLYSASINDNHCACPAASYFKKDHRIVLKDGGAYKCDPEQDGAHGDTFDSGKLAEYALASKGGALTTVAGIRMGGNATNRPNFQPRRLG